MLNKTWAWYAMPLLAVVIVALAAVPVLAQDAVTADEVNTIASKLYCPVCENIPLDTCGTAACEDWRYEIQLQLEQGFTEEQIIDDFINRFGERVVGTPQDPLLRAISLVTPWVVSALLLVLVGYTISKGMSSKPRNAEHSSSDGSNDPLRSQLEQDLMG